MPFIKFFLGGGYKIFVYIAITVGIYFGTKYVVSTIKDGQRAQDQLVQAQLNMAATLRQNNVDITRITNQNQQLLQYAQTTRNNVATIGVLSSRLATLAGTLTPDVSPIAYQAQLQAVVHSQYTCLNRVINGENNATCS